MIGKETLADIGIKDWQDFSHDFDGADLLLGNGFSLRFSELFLYESLFEEFLKECQPDQAKLFRKFGTSNFEFIQEQLLIAKKVNEIFGIADADNLLDTAIQQLQFGLVTAVHGNHPLAQDINTEELEEVSKDLKQFEDVFTLNYDLFLYRIIMLSKSLSSTTGDRYHNDYFWRYYQQDLLQFVDFDIYDNKHVYYLHGALFLFPGRRIGHRSDLKLRRGNESFTELIRVISAKIKQGIFPLFVSEGRWQDKMVTIRESPYLGFAYRKFEESERPLVIYGWSVSDQDKHILTALNLSKKKAVPNQPKRKIAISQHIGNKTRAQLEKEFYTISAKLSHNDVTVFDSTTLFSS